MSDTTPLDGVMLTIEALNGLEFAASRRDGRPISTTDILLGLLSADAVGSWEGIQLKANYLDAHDAVEYTDPDQRPAGNWRGIPLTATATSALETAVHIAADYHLVPLPPGVVALGLLSDSSSGACRALLTGTDCSHADVLDMVQSDVLDVHLDGLDLSQVAPSTLTTRLVDRLSRRQGQAPPATVRTHNWIEQKPGALSVLADAVDLADGEPELKALLSCMLLNSADLRQMDRDLRIFEDVPADDVRNRAVQRFGSDPPDTAAVIVAAALAGSARTDEALRRLGLSSNEVAAQIAEYRLRRDGNDSPTGRTYRLTWLNGLAGVVTSVLVVRAAISDGGHWWQLLFLWLVWTGHPQFGPGGSTVVAAILAILVSPLPGAAHLLGIAADVAQSGAERRAILARTGVKLSDRELRATIQRRMNPRAGQFRSLLQTQRAFWRARREGRDDAIA